jgi:hypothetical protein
LKRVAGAAERETGAADLPGLTPGEIERLALIAEACARVAAEAGWVLREGWRAPAPSRALPNCVALERELGRVWCVISLMHDAGDVRTSEMRCWQQKFQRILAQTTRHQVIVDLE